MQTTPEPEPTHTSHNFEHEHYEKIFGPALTLMMKEHHLRNVRWREECWIDSDGIRQVSYVIKAESLTSEEAVDLSLEIEERLNYSFPAEVTVRFSSND